MRFLTKRNIFILSGIIFFLILAFLLKRPEEKPNGESLQQTSQVQEYKNLKLGQSNKEDAIKSLGEPINIKQEENSEILEYKSTNPNFNNQISIENNNVSFVKEIVTQTDGKNISSITDKYGQASHVLYGPRAGVGFYLYTYPEKGIAYIGHQNSGILLEIWYFTPTTYSGFKAKYAKEYSESKQIIQ